MTKTVNSNKDGDGTKRISVYIYDAQLKKIDEICKKRNKSKRTVFFEAFQIYISLFNKGEV